MARSNDTGCQSLSGRLRRHSRTAMPDRTGHANVIASLTGCLTIAERGKFSEQYQYSINWRRGWDSNPRRTHRFKRALIQVDSPDLLPMRIGHGAVALDVSDDLPVIVADLQAPLVARIINVTDLLPMRVGDVVARRGRGGRATVSFSLRTALIVSPAQSPPSFSSSWSRAFLS